MKKSCFFKEQNIKHIDYKDIKVLRRFINPYSRMKTRRYTGVCGTHQRELAVAIKRARFMGLLPYIAG
ncbi:MAG: 30S ribosomal protein S18 [Candidatus Campbellbacteria bacterium]|nr:30S ribosomal protein S18 [Candidatus Campbellbacteria bacterium]